MAHVKFSDISVEQYLHKEELNVNVDRDTENKQSNKLINIINNIKHNDIQKAAELLIKGANPLLSYNGYSAFRFALFRRKGPIIDLFLYWICHKKNQLGEVIVNQLRQIYYGPYEQRNKKNEVISTNNTLLHVLAWSGKVAEIEIFMNKVVKLLPSELLTRSNSKNKTPLEVFIDKYPNRSKIIKLLARATFKADNNLKHKILASGRTLGELVNNVVDVHTNQEASSNLQNLQPVQVINQEMYNNQEIDNNQEVYYNQEAINQKMTYSQEVMDQKMTYSQEVMDQVNQESVLKLLMQEKFSNSNAISNIQVPNIQVPNIQIPNIQIPNTQVSNIQIPNTQVPNIQIPNTQVPNIQIPNTQVPNIQIPNIQIPNIQVSFNQIPNTQVPNIQVPNIKIPNTKVSNIQIPNTQVPNIQVPNIQIPNTQVSNIQISNTQVPNIQIPNTQVPNIQIPNSQVPNIQVPNIQVPNIQVPNIQVPNIQVPNIQVPNIQVPNIQIPNIQVSNIRIPYIQDAQENHLLY